MDKAPFESCINAREEEDCMSGKSLAGEGSRSVEDLHHLRLTALLGELVQDEGRMKAAEILGVSYRTLARAVESGSLSGRMRDALERVLLTRGDSAAEAQQREQAQALEERVEELEGRMEAVEKDRGGAVEAGGGTGLGELEHRLEESARTWESLERRVSRLEERRDGPPDNPVTQSPPRERGRAARGQVGPGVVTREPHPGEEDSYGRGMVLVEEWRRLNRQREEGTRLDQARTRERIMELEIDMIGELGLTLPPDTEPLSPSHREGYLGWRRRELADIRAERARREVLRLVRRVFTLGLWWR